jgi:hypothetical protein
MYTQLWQLLEESKEELALVQREYLLAPSKYQQLKNLILPTVEYWEWSSSLPRYELDPLYFLNDTARRGKAAKKAPLSTSGKHQYGFDMNGRIVAERQHVEFPGQFYECFYIYSKSEITSYLFDYSKPKSPINCTRLFLENGTPVSQHTQARQGHTSNVYISEGGNIKYFCWLASPDGRKPFGSCGEVEFKEPDVVELWHIFENGTRKLSFSGNRSCYNTLLQAQPA